MHMCRITLMQLLCECKYAIALTGVIIPACFIIPAGVISGGPTLIVGAGVVLGGNRIPPFVAR